MAHKLTVYHRTGCHLCEDMLAQLTEMQKERDFQLEIIDIQGSPELEAEYGTLVPVLKGDGQDICHYFLDQVALRRYFEGG